MTMDSDACKRGIECDRTKLFEKDQKRERQITTCTILALNYSE